MDFNRDDYYNKGEVMKRIGWTAKKMRQLIKKSDEIKTVGIKKVEYFLKSRVEMIEKQDIFVEKEPDSFGDIVEVIKDKIHKKWFKSNDTQYVVHVGQTNSGKTYNAVKELKQAQSGLYLCPLRLLAWEIYEDFVNDGLDCNLITGEEKIINPYAKITASTIEMCDYSKNYDVVIIDECFMLSDKERGRSWLKAICEVNANKVFLIVNEESLNLIEKILTDLNRNYEIRQHARLVPLEISPSTQSLKKIPPRSILITFSRIDVLIYKKLLETKNNKVSVLYGNLPPEVKKEQIQRFISGKSDIMISTDVIGMGLNLPCDNVIFLKTEKYDGDDDRQLYPFELKQIAGRAGRYLQSNQGTVSAIKHTDLNYIKKNFFAVQPFKESFYGIDKDIFLSLPHIKYYDRFKYFATLTSIVPKHMQYIKLEDISKFLELAKYPFVNHLTPHLAWAMFTMPVKEGNLEYWQDSVHLLSNNKNIKVPDITHCPINDVNSLKECEDIVSKLDLFFYFVNNMLISKYIDSKDLIELEKTQKKKENIIQDINDFLVNKKLSNIKKCKTCQEPIGWTNFNYCKECWNNELDEI